MFNLEIGRVVEEVKKNNAKRVLIQLPDGLKPRAKEIVDAIEKQTGAKAFVWLSSCFGGCDIPLGLNTIQIDNFIQFGHNKYNKTKGEW